MSATDKHVKNRLVSVTLDEASIGRGNPDQEHERQIAIYDLVEANIFGVEGHDGGPYALKVAMHEQKLLFDVRTEIGDPVALRCRDGEQEGNGARTRRPISPEPARRPPCGHLPGIRRVNER